MMKTVLRTKSNIKKIKDFWGCVWKLLERWNDRCCVIDYSKVEQQQHRSLCHQMLSVKMNQLSLCLVFAVVVYVTFTLLLCQLVHANFCSHQWSKWSQHKSYAISKFGTGAWALAWTSIQWLLTCTTTANTEI